jgi:hypothetical protein
MAKAAVLLDKLKRILKGGAYIGGKTNYLDIDNAGAITQAGTGTATWTGTHTFATVNATTGTVTTLTGTTLIIGASSNPTSSSFTDGTAGQIAFGGSYLYLFTSAGSWLRFTGASW